MRLSLSVLLVSSLALGACGVIRDSSLNPTNWFGRSTSEAVADAGPANPLIPTRTGLFGNRGEASVQYIGEPFDQIVALTIERVAGGAIIRAEGRADRQGIYAVQLTPATQDETPVDGVLTYRLEGILPNARTRVGNEPTREVSAARRLTDQELRGVRSIRVEGQRNALVSQR
ncbi:MAG: hypothetical protein WBG95_01055 [Sulfitobacter sp.]